MIGNGSVSKRADRAHRRHAGPRAAGQEGHSGREDCDRTGPSTADGKSRWRICLRRRLPNGAKRSADARKWRGLSLYGLDGTTIRVPDSPENRAAFGGSYAGALRGESGYPQVRAVAVMALRSHVMSAFRFADYATGETTLGARCLERSAGGLTRDRGPQLPWSRTSSFTSRAAAIATGCRGRRRERATRSSKS